MLEQEINEAAEMIIKNPKLRAKYFSNPTQLMEQIVPMTLKGRFAGDESKKIKEGRVDLGNKLAQKVSEDKKLSAWGEAYTERDTYFKNARQNLQRTFNAILWISYATFSIGVALIVMAIIGGFAADGNIVKTVLASLSGTGGLIATLCSLHITTRDSIRRVNGDNVQIRMILSTFTTELANLRSIDIKDSNEVLWVNNELKRTRDDAVRCIQIYTEPKGEAEGHKQLEESKNYTESAKPT